jgi:2-oxoisovalerate dehydrogenase E1 component
MNSFAESLAGRIASHCWEQLDAPVKTLGAANVPAVPLNVALEAEMLPNADKVFDALSELLEY